MKYSTSIRQSSRALALIAAMLAAKTSFATLQEKTRFVQFNSNSVYVEDEYAVPSDGEYYVNTQTPAPIVDGAAKSADSGPTVPAKHADAEKKAATEKKKKETGIFHGNEFRS